MAKPKPLTPFDEHAAEIVLQDLRGGKGLVAAMARARLTERTVFAWMRHADRRAGGPELACYKRFARAFRAILAAHHGTV